MVGYTLLRYNPNQRSRQTHQRSSQDRFNITRRHFADSRVWGTVEGGRLGIVASPECCMSVGRHFVFCTHQSEGGREDVQAQRICISDAVVKILILSSDMLILACEVPRLAFVLLWEMLINQLCSWKIELRASHPHAHLPFSPPFVYATMKDTKVRVKKTPCSSLAVRGSNVSPRLDFKLDRSN